MTVRRRCFFGLLVDKLLSVFGRWPGVIQLVDSFVFVFKLPAPEFANDVERGPMKV